MRLLLLLSSAVVEDDVVEDDVVEDDDGGVDCYLLERADRREESQSMDGVGSNIIVGLDDEMYRLSLDLTRNHYH